ncbi:hypothetical protein FOF46_18160 [Aquimarina algiphila]|uniref:Exo-alpha-sialidase n=2 Tax=Aquimarina algiphila TaxID=2047982 RepID=A0A554VH35_9FLAO|nr:hypothetical protein FOF46_18160 [Aquimarina algiphila]
MVMKKKASCILIICCFMFFSYNICAQQQPQINYFDSEPPPADAAVLFAEGIISLKNRWEEKITFSPDGKECFFGRHPDGGNNYFKPKLMHSIFENGKWSTPKIAKFTDNKIIGYPLFSADGKKIFMEQPIDNGAIARIVFSEKENNTWSEVDSIIPNIKAKKGFGLAQLTKNNTFYFYDRHLYNAYSSKFKNGKYSKPKLLPYRINPCAEFFISPNDDYIIFKPLHWSNPFHISFKNDQGKWSLPLKLNQSYFTKNPITGYGPYVSPDGKYFFFGKDGDIYWVKTDFIEVLRKKSQSNL